MLDVIDQVAQGTWHEKAFTIAHYVSYAIFAIALTGVITLNPKYIGILNAALKYYVGLFLILRFNPWSKRLKSKATRDFDKRIAFTGGIFLLLTTTAAGVVRQYATSFTSQASHAISTNRLSTA